MPSTAELALDLACALDPALFARERKLGFDARRLAARLPALARDPGAAQRLAPGRQVDECRDTCLARSAV